MQSQKIDMTKVSVIIPNYNHARFLKQRIESVLSQTYQNFEIIFLDDASTDNSRKAFSEYANHPRINHAVFNEANSGSPFRQWNKGLALAKGEYIWIAESDDFADLTILEKLVEKLDSCDLIGLAYSQSWQIDEEEVLICNMNHHTNKLDEDKWLHDYVVKGIDECANFLAIQNTIPNASAVVFRKCFAPELNSDIEKYKLSGDWLFWIKMLLKSDLAFVSEPLNYFRCHQKTARSLTNMKTHILERIKIVDFLLQSVKIPDKTLMRIQSSMIDDHFTESFNYRDFLIFYREILSLNYNISNKLTINILIAKKMFSLLVGKLYNNTKARLNFNHGG